MWLDSIFNDSDEAKSRTLHSVLVYQIQNETSRKLCADLNHKILKVSGDSNKLAKALKDWTNACSGPGSNSQM
jgi:hypothetical protein